MRDRATPDASGANGKGSRDVSVSAIADDPGALEGCAAGRGKRREMPRIGLRMADDLRHGDAVHQAVEAADADPLDLPLAPVRGDAEPVAEDAEQRQALRRLGSAPIPGHLVVQ